MILDRFPKFFNPKKLHSEDKEKISKSYLSFIRKIRNEAALLIKG